MPSPRISSNELAWLIESTARLNSARLELLKALQASLPRSDDEGDDSPTGTLKGALTNVIIMQTRIGDREHELAALVRDGGPSNGVAADEEYLAWRSEIASAQEHVAIES